MTKAFYCALCWQEFNDPTKHNEGSWFKGERLDKSCKGDIRRAEGRVYRPRVKPDLGPELNLDAGEPLRIGAESYTEPQ